MVAGKKNVDKHYEEKEARVNFRDLPFTPKRAPTDADEALHAATKKSAYFIHTTSSEYLANLRKKQDRDGEDEEESKRHTVDDDELNVQDLVAEHATGKAGKKQAGKLAEIARLAAERPVGTDGANPNP